MKRSKRYVNCQSPSSSTPAYARHGMGVSPFRDPDTDLEHLQMSPLLCRSKLASIQFNTLEVDVQQNSRKGYRCSPAIGENQEVMPSPDGQNFSMDLSDRSINRSHLSDHLEHSLSFARRMAQKAEHLHTCLSQTNLSMSPRLLFTSESDVSSQTADSMSEQRRRLSQLDDLNMHAYMSIGQQTSASVERYARLAEICPDLLNRSTVNRFVTRFVPGERCSEERPSGINPIFNCQNLSGSFSSICVISKTRLAVVYKARHRLSGVLYCLKRSRSDFEAERSLSGSSIEVLNEVQALSILQHTNITRFYSSWYESDAVYVQVEYCLGGSLFNYLHPDRHLDTSEPAPGLNPMDIQVDIPNDRDDVGSSENESQQNVLPEKSLHVLAAHVLSALHYMHANWSMVHGDVKPSNILIQLRRPEAYLAATKDSIEVELRRRCHRMLHTGDIGGILFKLADFGRASRAGEDRDGEDLGDGRYLPSLNDPSPPATAATGRDMYALGITLYHSAGGAMEDTVWERLRETGCPPDLKSVPVSLRTIVKKLLRPMAQDRPTASELINCPILKPYTTARSEDVPSAGIDMDLSKL